MIFLSDVPKKERKDYYLLFKVSLFNQTLPAAYNLQLITEFYTSK